MVLVLGGTSHLAVSFLLESTRFELRSGAALVQAAQSLADAEHALQVGATRLSGAMTFPASGCAAGLCANRQAPAADGYDWLQGGVHQNVAGVSAGGYWIESLGSLAAGQSNDCTGSSGGCEYVRLIASAAPAGVRRTLEACYRIRRAAGTAPVVTRISWRQTRSP